MSSFYTSCCLLVILVHCAVSNIPATGPRCFKCEDRIDTTSCSNFTVCGSHEKCYAESYINSMGAPMVRQGCRAATMCMTKKRDTGITCSICCDGNYCNSAGCGYSGFSQNSYTHGPLCLSCHGSDTTHCYLHIERCLAKEKCLYNSRSQNSIVGCGGYHACLYHQCCNGDFCNDNCLFNISHVNQNHLTTRTPGITTRTTKSAFNSHWVSAQGSTDSAIRTTKTAYNTPQTAQGPTCFSCQNVPHPSSCYNMTSCGQHETCAVKQELNTLGYIYYWTGCMDHQICIYNQRERTGLCTQCCQGDHCNYHGCGTSGYSHNLYNLGPMCFSCDEIDNPSKCTKIKRCTANEVCYIEKKSTNHHTELYSGGCKHINDCHGDGSCCSTDLCNDNIHISSSRVSRTTAAYPITSQWVTADEKRLSCLLCVKVQKDFRPGCETGCSKRLIRGDCIVYSVWQVQKDFRHGCETGCSGRVNVNQLFLNFSINTDKNINFLADQKRLSCLLCVTSPEGPAITCSNIYKTCNINEACYQDTTLVASRKIYTFGCTDKMLCRQTHHQALNAIIGKRSDVDKRFASTRTCCFADNCNAKGINIISTTPSPQLSVTSIMSSTTVATALTTPKSVTVGGSKPVITYITPSMSLNTGNSGIFVCKATGVPKPMIDWTGPIHHRHPSTNVDEETIQNSILLTKVTVDNSGYYTCVAHNEYGVTYQTVHLGVV